MPQTKERQKEAYWKNHDKKIANRRAWYNANRDEINRKRREARNENRDIHNAKRREYTAKNPDKSKKWAKKSYETHRAARLKQKVEYYQRHKAEIGAYQRQWTEQKKRDDPAWITSRRMRRTIYAAARRGITVDLDALTVDVLYGMVRSTPACPYCGTTLKIDDTRAAPSLDKVIPDRGYVRGNVDVICRDCNRKKDNSTAAEHRAFADRMDTFATVVIP